VIKPGKNSTLSLGVKVTIYTTRSASQEERELKYTKLREHSSNNCSGKHAII